MKSIKVITSPHKPYYDSIGKHCITSFLEFWPKEIKLELYAEEFDPNITDERLVVNRMNSVLNTWQQYINLREVTKKTKMAKFWLKSFVKIHAMENTSEDILIWLDSDVITHKNISVDYLESLLPEDHLLCDIPSLGKLKNKESETGFCMINTKHKDFSLFLSNYKKFYETKEGTSALPRDIDSSVWWAARQQVVSTGTKVNGLSSTINSHVPFMGTCLKDYMRHWVTKSNKAAYQKNHDITFEEQGIYNSTVEKSTGEIIFRK